MEVYMKLHLNYSRVAACSHDSLLVQVAFAKDVWEQTLVPEQAQVVMAEQLQLNTGKGSLTNACKF